MAIGRKRLISIAVLAFAAVHVVVLVTRQQHWPIVANSTGLADKWEREFGCYVPYAIPATEGVEEFRLWQDMGAPQNVLTYVFWKLVRYPHRSGAYERLIARCPSGDADARQQCASRKLVHEALSQMYRAYEKASRKRPGTLAPLRGIKLYDVRYEMTEIGKFEVKSMRLYTEWDVAPNEAGSR